MTSHSLIDTAREALAQTLKAAGDVRDPALLAAVREVPREQFLRSGVFLLDEDGRWTPITRERVGPEAWAEIAYRNESLVTQLDGSLTPHDIDAEAVMGFPTSSSTIPSTVVAMIEDLKLDDGIRVLELGTGTGYSTALLSRRLGEDNVTSVEVDANLADRAREALEVTGLEPWTVTGDGLLGHPAGAPYDRVVATFAARRVPYTWVRQTRPGGIIVATVGAWSYGTALARLVVGPDGTAVGRFIRESSFMPARSHALEPISGDLSARAAYADSERVTSLDPVILAEWMPALLTQLAAPGAQLVRALPAPPAADSATDQPRAGEAMTYLFDIERESFAEVTATADGWLVRQGGPLALWDTIEDAVSRWQQAGSPGITDIEVTVAPAGHSYTFTSAPHLHWFHPVAP